MISSLFPARKFSPKTNVGTEWNKGLMCRDHALLQCTSISTYPFHWISGYPPEDLELQEGGMEVMVQIRHRMKPVPARISLNEKDQS